MMKKMMMFFSILSNDIFSCTIVINKTTGWGGGDGLVVVAQLQKSQSGPAAGHVCFCGPGIYITNSKPRPPP